MIEKNMLRRTGPRGQNEHEEREYNVLHDESQSSRAHPQSGGSANSEINTRAGGSNSPIMHIMHATADVGYTKRVLFSAPLFDTPQLHAFTSHVLASL